MILRQLKWGISSFIIIVVLEIFLFVLNSYISPVLFCSYTKTKDCPIMVAGISLLLLLILFVPLVIEVWLIFNVRYYKKILDTSRNKLAILNKSLSILTGFILFVVLTYILIVTKVITNILSFIFGM